MSIILAFIFIVKEVISTLAEDFPYANICVKGPGGHLGI